MRIDPSFVAHPGGTLRERLGRVVATLILAAGLAGPAASTAIEGEPPLRTHESEAAILEPLTDVPEASEPLILIERLAALGPRLPATPAHVEARAILAESLRRLGLEEIEVAAMPNGTRNVGGLLRGADPSAGEIVLAAHYDTVADSPGAADDASGCAVVLGTVLELRRAPLRRSLRVVFFDGEEAGLLGSGAWVGSLSALDRERILGVLDLDVVGIDRSGAPVVLDLGGAALPPGRGRAPAWLVHAALRAGRAVGFRFRVGDHRLPLLAQILTRTARVPWSSDAVPILAAGIPALLLTDFSALHPDDAIHGPEDRPDRLAADRMARWITVTTALVLRLDALEGRPLWEEEYLAFAGKVWIRRDLLWVGLLLWIALVVGGRPGRWVGARTAERRARGRSYMPGYLFRLAFLIAAIWMPSLAAPLIYPLAPLGLLAPRTNRGRVAVAAAAFLPTAVWLALLAVAGALGLASGFALELGKAALIVGTLAAFGWQLWSRPSAGGGALAAHNDGGPLAV